MKKTLIKIKDTLKKWFDAVSRFFTKIVDVVIKFFNRYHFTIMIILILVVVMIAKSAFISISSGDSYWHLVPWTKFIRDHGGLAAIKEIPVSAYQTNFHSSNVPYGHPDLDLPGLVITGTMYANYPVFYYTLLAIFSYLPISDLAVIKIVSFIFDALLAFGTLAVLRHFTSSKGLQIVGFSLALLLPTFFINSSIWGQSDAIYAAMAVWFIYFMIKERPMLATVFLGLGLTIKIQILFIFPILGWLWLKRKYKLWYLLIPILVVFVSFIPNYIAGMPFMTPINHYLNLAGTYSAVNMNSGSIYAFFEGINSKLSATVTVFNRQVSIVDLGGIPLMLIICILLIYYVYYKGIKVDKYSLLLMGTIFAFLSPFLLPHMHERYFYMGEALLLVYVIAIHQDHKRWYLVLLSQASSLITYANFLLGGSFLPGDVQTANVVAAILNLIVIMLLLKDLSLLNREDDVVLSDVEQTPVR